MQKSDNEFMAFEAIISSPGRLEILTSLAEQTPQDFVELRRRTRLTDGNLTTHAKRLAGAGLVNVRKAIRDARPVTTLELTTDGRAALERHVRRLLDALEGRAANPAETIASPAPGQWEPQDDWVD